MANTPVGNGYFAKCVPSGVGKSTCFWHLNKTGNYMLLVGEMVLLIVYGYLFICCYFHSGGS